MEITEIIRRWQAGAGIRPLARMTGLSRNTIKKYVVAAEACGLARDGPAPIEAQLTELPQFHI
ncbi:MAG: hypothetical protein Q7R34_07570 [Dehalococcoidia bacterium]|nr:hypothetical protein [Dehalococcoidia bacterium]